MTIDDMYEIVENEMFCAFDVFQENVINSGISWCEFCEEMRNCKDHEDLVMLANKYI